MSAAQIEQGDAATHALAGRLESIIGAPHVLRDLEQRRFYSTDLSYTEGEIAALVVQPGNADELARCVGVATEAGFAVVPRGGGMSYTRGYQPERPDSILVDLQRMSQVIEVNTTDMYVIVEAGCTWKTLFETLGEYDVRTPYFGPLSGMYATIGGAVSQNSLFLGSGLYNTVAESLMTRPSTFASTFRPCRESPRHGLTSSIKRLLDGKE